MENKDRGIFYAIGIGPGNPEMLTLQAVRILKEADVIAAPRETVEDSVVYKIAVEAVPEIAGKEKLAFCLPMTRDMDELTEAHQTAAERTKELLNQGKNVAAMTLGDPGVYATTMYIMKLLKKDGYKTELICGIPSFCAAANASGIGLASGEETIRIMSAKQYMEGKSPDDDVTVIMKTGRQMPGLKKKLIQTHADVRAVSDCGTINQRIYKSAEEIPDEAGYYTLVIVRMPK